MHEVIHLSYGPEANELNSKFFNKQQSYFVYSAQDLPKSHVDPSVRFCFGREYTPRTGFWDYRNGFGKWKQYNEKYEPYESPETIANLQERKVAEIIRDNSNIESWTSSLRVPIHPSGLHTIPDWEFDPEKFPFGHQRGANPEETREFDVIDEGSSQFQQVSHESGGKGEDYLDATFRPLIEKCDLLDGVNLITDMGGWAGFTLPYIEIMRDEYIPKSPLFTWCFSRKQHKYRWSVQKSRIEALAGFAEHSSLVIPLQDQIETHTAVDFARNAEYHLPLFETYSLLSSLRRNRVSMHDLYQDLTNQIPNASIVQPFNTNTSNNTETLNEFQGDTNRVKNIVTTWRGEGSYLTDTKDNQELSNEFQNKKEYLCPQPLNTSQQMPVKFKLEINDNPLKLRNLTVKGDHELRELVHSTTDPYIWGWNEPSDDDDVF